MNISRGTENAFDKNQCPCIIKSISNPIKAIHTKYFGGMIAQQ